jgi:hypothetical protein
VETDGVAVNSSKIFAETYNSYVRDRAMAAIAQLDDGSVQSRNTDPHLDTEFLNFMSSQSIPPGTTEAKLRALKKRAKSYLFKVSLKIISSQMLNLI